jgi:hypothetical protein
MPVFGGGFIDLCNDQPGLGYRAPHEVVDTHNRLGFHIAALRLSVQACSFLPRHEQAKSALIW